ncbi:MAG: peptidoglycan DD-metalloendopeptidase family protein [Kordiimonas sp.]
MLSWQQILERIKTEPQLIKAWSIAKRAGKASESPAGFGTIAAIGLSAVIYINLPDTPVESVPSAISDQPAQVPEAANKPAIPAPDPIVAQPEQESFKLRRRETLIGLLKRAKIQTGNAHAAVNALGDVTNLRKLQAGQTIHLTRSAENSAHIAELRIRDTFKEEAVALVKGSGYDSKREPVTTYALTDFVEGEITDSLFLSAQREGMPTKVIVDLIRMLSFDVDFEREIRVGDHFEVYFERSYAPGFDDLENGRILRAKLTMRKREVDAFFFKDNEGHEGYYDSKGQSTRRALMKTPLDVVYVTDSYGPRKKHPVLGYRTMHTGTDFRARPGTPIMASGDGVIEMAARNGGYGKYIRIRHNGTYKTAYAHLSRYGKGIKKGRRVKQGQIIGYSGATGRVSGPHLHYEVHVNGKPVNPLTLKLPTGRTLKGQELLTYQKQTEAVLADMEKVRELKTILFAQQDTPDANITNAR